MKKAQELSMNLIVVGALSLTVLLIVGGLVIFGPWDLLSSFTSSSDSSQQLLMTKCSNKCSNLKYYSSTPEDLKDDQLKTFCCEYAEVNGKDGINNMEICANAFSCKLNGKPVDCSSYSQPIDCGLNPESS